VRNVGLIALQQSRQAKLKQIEAITTSADSLFALNMRLESLVPAIRAKRLLTELGDRDELVEAQVNTSLLQALYGIDEINRLQGGNIAAFSPDGDRILASGSHDSTIKLWRRNATGSFGPKPDKTFAGHSSTISSIKFSPDGKTLASASWDQTIKPWTLDGVVLKTFEGHSARIWKLA
jgi:WD40 repeat protein